MNQLFNYEGKEVRTVTVEGEPWFVAKDVCEVIGVDRTVVRRVDGEDKTTVHLTHTGSSYSSDTVVINESGLYTLILGSRKPEARKFKRWVTAEVLPTIRKTGMYATDTLLDDPDLLLKTVTRLRDERNARLAAEAKLTEQAPKVAAYDTLIDADGTQSMGQAAKALGYGRNKMFSELRQMRVLTQENTPYQQYIDAGYFEVVEACRAGSVYPTTRVTPKGLDFLFRKLQTDGGEAVVH